jgi:drug/metabolite transporter (DMT)-like permease
MNPTLIGFLAVLIWGISLPFIRMAEEQIGVVAYIGGIYTASGTLCLIWLFTRRRLFPGRKIFSNPMLYARWLIYVSHVVLINTAVSIVRKTNAPFVMLLNYLWPTAVIMFSILLAGVKISRLWAFLAGSAIVLISMSIEILGPHSASADLFGNTTDLMAYVMAFFAALTWGAYSALSRRAGDATGGNLVLPFFQCTLALALPFSFFDAQSKWDHLTGWLALLLCGYSVLQFIALLSWDLGIRRGNIVILSLGADFIPWLSLFTFSVMFHTEIETRTVLAAVLLVAGAMITRYGTLPKRARFAAPKAQLNLEREPP